MSGSRRHAPTKFTPELWFKWWERRAPSPLEKRRREEIAAFRRAFNRAMDLT